MTAAEFKQISIRFLENAELSIVPVSLARYRADLLRFERWLEGHGSHNLSLAVAHWTAAELRSYPANSVIGHRVTLSACFRWAIEEKLFPGPNPVKRIKTLVPQPTHRQAVTQEDVDKLLAARWPASQSFFPLLIRLAWATGLRLADCCLLQWSSVNLGAAVLTVCPQKKARYGERLEIPIPPELVEALCALRPSEPKDGQHVQPLAAYEYRCHLPNLSRTFTRVAARVGVNKSFHGLRHGVVSRLIEHDTHLAVIRSITGHSLKILEGYCHVAVEAKRLALSNRPGLNEPSHPQQNTGLETAQPGAASFDVDL